MYPDYPYFAVAITRTCGSGGGSYIGKQLAKAFDIDLYDRKLLRLASEDSGISEELFARADENTRKTMLYRVSERVYDGSIIPPESGNFISDENLFNYQAKVLRELLNEESYICVGRAADFVLRDKPNVLTVYVDASTILTSWTATVKAITNTTPAASGSGWKIMTSAWIPPPLGWITAWS